MDENVDLNERISVPNEISSCFDKKINKSLTSSFHIQKTLSNKINNNSIKKTEVSKKCNISKTNRIYFSSKKQKQLGYIQINPISPKIDNNYKDIHLKKLYHIPTSDQRVYKTKIEHNLTMNKNKLNNSIFNYQEKINKYKYNYNYNYDKQINKNKTIKNSIVGNNSN